MTPDFLELLGVLLARKAADCPHCWGVCARWACRDVGDSDPHKICR